MATKDHPGVYIPPPLFYITFFYFSILLQNGLVLGTSFLKDESTQFLGWVLLFIGVGVALAALYQFIKSKNTIVTIKSAHSLQTSGVYSLSRNPLYVSLFFIYGGLGILIGNWWTFILFPFLTLVMKMYVVAREEKYLKRKFGQQYKDYKKKVRRWM